MKTKQVSGAFRQSQMIRRMVITAMLGAITLLLAFTPVGMITLPPPLPAVTLVHIPVIVAALIEGPWVGVPVGLIFGLSSLIRAWGAGIVGLTLFFRNPLVSVIPRMLIPLAAWGAYAVLRRVIGRKAWGEHLSAGIAAAIGALTNTVLCLGAIVLFHGGELTTLVNNLIALGSASNGYMENAGAWLVTAVGVPNGLAELTVAAILVPMIKTAVDAVMRRGRRKIQTPASLDTVAGSAPQASDSASADAGATEPNMATPARVNAMPLEPTMEQNTAKEPAISPENTEESV